MAPGTWIKTASGSLVCIMGAVRLVVRQIGGAPRYLVFQHVAHSSKRRRLVRSGTCETVSSAMAAAQMRVKSVT